jgi:hypothetical protein
VVSDFFEPPPPFEPPPAPEWDGPPDATIPTTIPIEQVVARTSQAVVYLGSISVFPTGFEFDVFVLTDDSDSDLDPFDFEHRMVAQHTGELPPGQLRLGFLFPDGSKATNTGGYFNWHEDGEGRPDSPVMSGSTGGGGHRGTWHRSFWVWPLPPPGSLEFVCEWPAMEIPPTRLQLDWDATKSPSVGTVGGPDVRQEEAP